MKGGRIIGSGCEGVREGGMKGGRIIGSGCEGVREGR